MIAPVCARVPTCVPFTKIRCVDPSYVVATCAHVPATNADDAFTPRSIAPTDTHPLGRPVSLLAYNPYAKPLGCSFINAVRHPPNTDAFTHASNVIPDVKSNEFASGTDTTSSTPSNDTADPNRPDADHNAPPANEPPFPRPDESTTDNPEPLIEPQRRHQATRPGGLRNVAR